MSNVDPPLDEFQDDINEYLRQDEQHMPPAHCTVFAGSSTIRMWGADLERDFADIRAVNRGFGGAITPQVTYYARDIITRYKPDRIVFYCGTNDLALGHSAWRVFNDYRAFVSKVRRDVPAVEIYFISMSMAPSRLQFRRQYRLGNLLVWFYSMLSVRLRYIDVTHAMQDAHGNPKPEYFGDDALHMTPAGYAVWLRIIRRALKLS